MAQSKTYAAVLGRELRRRREALGLTLEDVAERSELSPNYIGTVEHGKRDPSLSTLQALSKALDVPAAELLGPVQALSATGYEVGRQFDAAPVEFQELVLRVLRLVPKRRAAR